MSSTHQNHNNKSHAHVPSKKEEWYYEVINTDKNYYSGTFLPNGCCFVKFEPH